MFIFRLSFFDHLPEYICLELDSRFLISFVKFEPYVRTSLVSIRFAGIPSETIGTPIGGLRANKAGCIKSDILAYQSGEFPGEALVNDRKHKRMSCSGSTGTHPSIGCPR
jgi:hypothetical protein